MQLSSDLRERLIRTASGAGVALALALVALASPTPALAAGAAASHGVALAPHAAGALDCLASLHG